MKHLFFSRSKKENYSTDGSIYFIAWKKFIKNKINLFFLFIILIISILAILGYLITPDSTPYANKQNLELTLQKPGFKIDFLKIPNQKKTKTNFITKMFFGENENYNKIPIYSYTINNKSIVVERFTGLNPNDGIKEEYDLSIFANNLNINEQKEKKLASLIEKKFIFKQKFYLGTDRFGRDVLSQLIIGARVSLSVGFISVFISLLIGISLGAISAYFGGIADKIIMWIINVVWAIPSLFLVIAITFALGKGFWQIFFAVGLTLWVEIARLVRGLVISLKEKEYIEASVSLGYSHLRIIVNHILPGTMGPIIVISAANFASAILIEAGLSFLGIGVQAPMPSWGTMLRDNYGFLIMDYAYLAIIPGFAIMILVLSFMSIGNGLRDALDVKQIAKN